MQAMQAMPRSNWGRCGERSKARGAGTLSFAGPCPPSPVPHPPSAPPTTEPSPAARLTTLVVGSNQSSKSSALCHLCTCRTFMYHLLTHSIHSGRLIHPAYQDKAKTACLILYAKASPRVESTSGAFLCSFKQQDHNSNE